MPPFVFLSTASDPFPDDESAQQVVTQCLAILVRRGIGVTLSTRGHPTETSFRLLAAHASHVHVTVALPSLSQDYTATWEPGTAMPADRLHLVQRLRDLGVDVAVRLAPIIPFVNDQTSELRKVSSALAAIDIRKAMVSFLHIRPGVREQLLREAPVEARRLLLGCFPSTELDQHPPFEHLPNRMALASLRRIQRTMREHGIRVSACRCENPGLPAGSCPLAPPEGGAEPMQPTLFEDPELKPSDAD